MFIVSTVYLVKFYYVNPLLRTNRTDSDVFPLVKVNTEFWICKGIIKQRNNSIEGPFTLSELRLSFTDLFFSSNLSGVHTVNNESELI